jgi:chromosome segregation ATPase
METLEGGETVSEFCETCRAEHPTTCANCASYDRQDKFAFKKQRDALEQELSAEKEEARRFEGEWQEAQSELTRLREERNRIADLIYEKLAFKFTDPRGTFTELITWAQKVRLACGKSLEGKGHE